MYIVDIIISIIAIIFAFVSYFLKIKARIEAGADKAINHAEEIQKIGEEKMEFAIEEIKSIIPKAVKPFFSDDLIRRILQKAFDAMEDYAKKQVAKEKSNVDAEVGEA